MPEFFLDKLIDFVFPPCCLDCGREGDWLCSRARQRLADIPPVFNFQLPGLERIVIRGSYDRPPLAAIIQSIKYKYHHAAQPVIVDILRPLATELKQLPADAVIVPIPLHSRRGRQRGFNQSDLIAAAVHQLTGWSVQPLLKRRRATAAQAKLTEQARRINVKDAFALSVRPNELPANIMLVDDVITTGSTVVAGAAALRQAGAINIYACALAKG